MKQIYVQALCVLILILVTLLPRLLIVDDYYLGYDEADYKNAVSQGFLSNYFDSTSLPFTDFIKMGIQDYRTGERWKTSEYIRNIKDVSFLRHYHPPLTIYLAGLWIGFFGDSNISLRYFQIILCSILILTIYYIAKKSLPNLNQIVLLLVCILISGSSYLLYASMVFNTHIIFTILTFTSLYIFSRYLKTHNIYYWYGTCVSVAITLLSMELGLFLIITFFFILLFVENPLLSYSRFRLSFSKHLWIGVLISSIILFIGYPGGFLKLTWLRTGFFFGYLTLIKKSIIYKSKSIFDFLQYLFSKNPIEFVIFISGFVVIIKYLWSLKNKPFIPFIVYGILLTLLNFWIATERVEFFLASLIINFFAFVYMLTYFLKKKAVFIIMFMLLILPPSAYFSYKDFQSNPPRDRVLHDFLKNSYAYIESGDNHFISWQLLPTIQYYYPKKTFDTVHTGESFDKFKNNIKKRKYTSIILLSEDNIQIPGYLSLLETYYKNQTTIKEQRNLDCRWDLWINKGY